MQFMSIKISIVHILQYIIIYIKIYINDKKFKDWNRKVFLYKIIF